MTTCKRCGMKIAWVKVNGKFQPYNAETGELHFQECRTAQFKKSGRPLIGKPVLVVGKDYRPSGCDCGIPPWEVCKHSFDWAKTPDIPPPPVKQEPVHFGAWSIAMPLRGALAKYS